MRIGLLGSSKIGYDAIIKPGVMKVAGIASRNYEKAKKLADVWNIGAVYLSYEELIEAPEIDAVYIALPPVFQSIWTEKALKKDKKVLVEKPIALSLNDITGIDQIMRHNYNAILLEGVMTQHHNWQEVVKEMIDKGTYGKLLKISTVINMELPNEKIGYRCNKTLGGGAFFDQAAYWLQFVQFIVGLNFEHFSVDVRKYFSGVDWETYVKGKIDNVEICFETSYQKKYEVLHVLSLEKAEIRINNFFRAALGKFKIYIEVITNDKKRFALSPQNYYENQAKCFEVLDHSNSLGYWNKTKERIAWIEKIGDYI